METFQSKIEALRPSESDIDYNLAYEAHRNTSHFPEKRAKTEQKNYVNTVNAFIDKFLPLVRNDKQEYLLLSAISDYKKGYLSKYGAVLSSRSGLASPFIVGPSKFPVRQMEKKNRTIDKRYNEFIEWHDKFIERTRKNILDARSDEEKEDEEFLRAKRDILSSIRTIKGIDNGTERGYNRALFVSSIAGKIKRIAARGDAKLASKLMDVVKQEQLSMKKPVFAKNNVIWNIVGEAEEIKKKKEDNIDKGKSSILIYEGVEVINNPEVDRIQIDFDKKPEPAIISALKKEAWKWSPSQGVWQRKSTPMAVESAKRILNQFFKLMEKENIAPSEIQKEASEHAETFKKIEAGEIKTAEDLGESIAEDHKDKGIVISGIKIDNTVDLIKEAGKAGARKVKVVFKPAYDEKLHSNLNEELVEDLKKSKVEVFDIMEESDALLNVRNEDVISIEFIKDEIELQEIEEPFSDCLHRHGINLEKDHHRFGVDTELRDLKTNKMFKVVSIGDFITLREVPAFKNALTEPDFLVSYNELIDKFRSGELQVTGFMDTEVMEFARVLNTIQHCWKMDQMYQENERLRSQSIEMEKIILNSDHISNYKSGFFPGVPFDKIKKKAQFIADSFNTVVSQAKSGTCYFNVREEGLLFNVRVADHISNERNKTGPYDGYIEVSYFDTIEDSVEFIKDEINRIKNSIKEAEVKKKEEKAKAEERRSKISGLISDLSEKGYTYHYNYRIYMPLDEFKSKKPAAEFILQEKIGSTKRGTAYEYRWLEKGNQYGTNLNYAPIEYMEYVRENILNSSSPDTNEVVLDKSTEIKEAIEGLETLLSITTGKKKKAEIQEAIDGLQALLEIS